MAGYSRHAPEVRYERASSNTASGAPSAVTRAPAITGPKLCANRRALVEAGVGCEQGRLRDESRQERLSCCVISSDRKPKSTITISIGKVSNPTSHNIGIPASRMPRPTSLATKIG